MQDQLVSKETIDSLYRVAAELERRWANARLALDFSDRMIDAVIAFAQENQIRLNPRLATSLLKRFWTLSGRRDAARNALRPNVMSLEDCQIGVAPSYAHTDLALVEACRKVLGGAGIKPILAEAFLQSSLQDSPGAVVEALHLTFGQEVSYDTLRQWRHRHFGKVAQILRDHSDQIGLSEHSCHA